MDLIFYIILNQIFDCKIQIDFCLFNKIFISCITYTSIWIFESKYLPMKIAIFIFSLFSLLKSTGKTIL